MGKIKTRPLFAKIKLGAWVVVDIIIGIVVLISAFLGITYLSHYLQTQKEIEQMTAANMYHEVSLSTGDRANVALNGKKDSAHTIVPITDMYTNSLNAYMHHIYVDLKDTAKIAYVDRYGYGMSDDTKEKRTVEAIVENYRDALQSANINPPYILMANEFGGIYATYWSDLYPQEIEGIVYINTESDVPQKTENEMDKQLSDGLKIKFGDLGFQRFLNKDKLKYTSRVLTEDETSYAKAAALHSYYSAASLNEQNLAEENLSTVLNQRKPNDIPKVYVSSKYGFETLSDVNRYFNHKNNQATSLGLDPFYRFTTTDHSQDQKFIEVANGWITKSQENFNKKVVPFTEAVGNCQIVKIAGDANIFEQKPFAIAAVLTDFVKYLDGDIQAMAPTYDDRLDSAWNDWEYGSQTEPTRTNTD